MTTRPLPLRLADVAFAGRDGWWHTQADAELRRLHTLIAACEPYLKEGETPAERIERDHRDSLALMTLLAREKTKNEALLKACKRALRYSQNVVNAEGVFFDDDNDLPAIEAAIKQAEGATE